MISSKITSLTFDFINTISDLSRALGAIDLADGSALDEPPAAFVELSRVNQHSLHVQNPSLTGAPVLRDYLSNMIYRTHGHHYNPANEITIASNVNHALFASMAAFLKEGDEVLLFEPANEDYLPLIHLCGARPVYIHLRETGTREGDFYIDWNEVTRMVNSSTRLMIINSPHDPTGMVLTELDMLRLQKIIHGTNIILLFDERFEHLVFDGFSHQSVSMYPMLADKGIKVGCLPGLSWPGHLPSSYCAAPANLMLNIRKIVRIFENEPSPPIQEAIVEYIESLDVSRDITGNYRKKKELFTTLMTNNTRFTPLPANGTWFQLYNYSSISGAGDKEFAHKLLQEHGVATVPYSSFFHEKQKKMLLRFNFARPTMVLEKVVEKLSSI